METSGSTTWVYARTEHTVSGREYRDGRGESVSYGFRLVSRMNRDNDDLLSLEEKGSDTVDIKSALL